MGGSIIFDLVQPLQGFIPEIEQPKFRPGKTNAVSLSDRIYWTVVTLLIYLTASQIPLYGIRHSNDADPLAAMRAMLASSRGTLMELGITPVINAGWIMQLLTAMQLVVVDWNSDKQRAGYHAVNKISSFLLTVGMAVAYVASGMYGPVSELGFGNFTLLVAQLVAAGVLVMLLDDLCEKWGMGAGISLFIATSSCQAIVWSVFSPRTIDTPSGQQYQGAAVNLVSQLLTSDQKITGLKSAFYRRYSYNVTNILATVAIFIAVIYLQGFRKELPIERKGASKAMNQYNGRYPIKLLYMSTMPIILQGALISNAFVISRTLYYKFSGNPLVAMLGTWQNYGGGYSVPVGGLVYYISPPRSLTDLVMDPIHSVVYIAFMLGSSTLLSLQWLELSGQAPRDIAKRFQNQGIKIRGFSDTRKRLNEYIPVAAALGGFLIGGLTVVGELMGSVVSSTSMLLAVQTVHSYYEEIMKQAQEENGGMFPGMGGKGMNGMMKMMSMK